MRIYLVLAEAASMAKKCIMTKLIFTTNNFNCSQSLLPNHLRAQLL